MHELLKGTYWSLSLHGAFAGALVLFGVLMGRVSEGPPRMGIVLGGGGGPIGGGGGSGGRASGSGARDVGDLETDAPAPVKKAAKAAAAGNSQTSPTGPAVLAPKAGTKGKETQEERIARIRRSARPIAQTKTSSSRSTSTGTSKPIRADSIADRLLQGVSNGGSGSGGGSGPGSGGGSGGGTGTGRGAGTGSGSGRGGSGNGRGSGVGDGIGDGSGPGDPFYTAIATALYDAWDPPTRAEVGGGNPTVGVRITLRANGTVTAFQLSRPSGNAAMDSSLQAMLRALRQLPAPSSFGFKEPTKVIEVRFALDAVEPG